jgi:hypothetical protein
MRCVMCPDDATLADEEDSVCDLLVCCKASSFILSWDDLRSDEILSPRLWTAVLAMD